MLIHEQICKAMADIDAIGKNSKNLQQGFMYRGIDDVYNALNPIMAKHGLFICPEVLDMKREERTTKNGSVIIYTVLTVKYTIFASDGSNVTLTVVGEAMDSGDKGVNKAMSIAMKYAMFQLFFIPTEAVDPDSETHKDIMPKGTPVRNEEELKTTKTENNFTPPAVNTKASVKMGKTLPPTVDETPVMTFLKTARKGLCEKRMLTPVANNELFKKQREVLIKAGLAPDKELVNYSMEEAANLIKAMEKCFELTGTELITE